MRNPNLSLRWSNYLSNRIDCRFGCALHLVENQDAIIYFSEVVLVEGAWPVNLPPQFTDKDGTKGIWGNQPFVNLVRNAQFQHAWPYMEPKIFHGLSSKIQDLNPFHISSFISLFLDVPGTKWYTESSGNFIFHTFWAKFCWGQVPLINITPWLNPYLLLLFITLVGIIGALFTGIELVKLSKNEFAFLFIIIVMTVMMTLFYDVYVMGGSLRFRAYIPTARYIFPAIIPISLILVTGWQGLLSTAAKVLKFPIRFSPLFYLGFFICLDLYSIISVLIFFKHT